nr:lipopolysaccharide biosynthesis protein [Jiella flava]
MSSKLDIASTLRKLAARVVDHRERLTNVAHLFTGNVLASLLALAAFAVTARALGPYGYGQLALIYASVQLIERLVSFQSWQPIIRFGANLEGAAHRENLRVLLKFGMLLDLAGAVCGFLIAMAAGVLLASLFGWSQETHHLFMLYAGVLLFQLSGMPTAVQRLAGNFRLLAYGQLVTLSVRASLCAAGLHFGGGLGYFALVWGGTQVLGSITTIVLAFIVLRRQGVTGILSAPLAGLTRRFPGIWRFAWSANASLTLWVSSQQLDTLIVGALADPAAAGVYHVAKRIGQLGQKLGGQVQAVLFPDVARLWGKGGIGEFKRVILEIEIMLVVLSLTMLAGVTLLIKPLIVNTAGSEFLAAAPLAVAQMVAVVLLMSGSVGRISLLAMGRQDDVLRAVIAGTIGFHAAAFTLIPLVGPIGAVIGQIVLGTIWLSLIGLALRNALKSRTKPPHLSKAATASTEGGPLPTSPAIPL